MKIFINLSVSVAIYLIIMCEYNIRTGNILPFWLAFLLGLGISYGVGVLADKFFKNE